MPIELNDTFVHYPLVLHPLGSAVGTVVRPLGAPVYIYKNAPPVGSAYKYTYAHITQITKMRKLLL